MTTQEDARWKSRLPYFQNNETWSLIDFLQWSIVYAKDFGKKEEEHRTYKICLEQLTQSPHLLKSHGSKPVQRLASLCLKSLEKEKNLSVVGAFWKNKASVMKTLKRASTLNSQNLINQMLDLHHDFSEALSNTTRETIEPALKRKSSPDPSERRTKKVVINPRNQTEYDSDVSDTTLEDWNEEKPEEFDAHTVTAPTIGLFYKGQSYWSSYEMSFQKIAEERKWHLSSGRNVEDVLYAYASKLEYEQPAHSFIIDTSDNNIKNLFTKTEWEEVIGTNKKTAPAIDKVLVEHLLSYKKKSPLEMRTHIMKPWLNTTYNKEEHFDFQYIHQVFSHLLDEYESSKNRLMQPHAEGWYAINVWSILIDKTFLNIPDIELVRGETCSVASSNRKNDDEMYRIKGQRKALGHRIDGIFQNTVNDYEYGGIEVAKTCQGPHDRKYLGNSLKLTKLLKDIFHQQSSIVDYDETVVKKIEMVGLLHSRLQLQQFLMDFGGGSCLRLRKETTRNIPLHLGDVMELISTVISILQAKLRIQRCIGVLKNEPEDELFLHEITQPSSRPSTPPRTVHLA
ncbi:3832_t:CDS:2 [Scutellospora calospora]|uniref:3832_t:CDS:1 n=2 Tax=Gigasporaceae TaxID=36753 RepID=A0ACA9KD59_9GLOM|nr:3832_t:CDS:2 [Scutellospora calospora]